MKDLLITLVEYIFHTDSEEEITLKKPAILAFKILIFMPVVALVVWTAIQLRK